MERLQKVIANSGYCSRRKAEEYIAKKQVTVNGEVATLGMKVSEKDIILINQTALTKEEKEYFLLYKPANVISSVKDEKKRPTVVDIIPTKTRIYPVGRLDYNTTGLLLLTNDGELSNFLTHPKNEIEKTYTAKINGILSPSEIMELKKGIVIEERKVHPTFVKVKKINQEHQTSTITIGITEGRNHIVKKLFAHFGYKVVKLKRESYAFLTLEGLKEGEFRPLTRKEIKKLYSLR